ncbi:hypothetical protein ACU610_21660 [Geodermatophilus sp. URMC 61]|uniref:hypothetical protein n=1 Tax=Geodermatophilus sp. URMC 61 TaxID=3423411 RepID=UPI00406C972D
MTVTSQPPAVVEGAEPPHRARHRRSDPLGWLPVLAVVQGAAVLLVAVGNTVARAGHWSAPVLWWVGVLLILLPTAWRLLQVDVARTERLGLVGLLALSLYLVKVVYEPGSFLQHDELGHWRSVDDILLTGGLFAPNPVVGSYAVFPGLEIVTAALVQLTGMSVFAAGTIVVGIARVIGLLALYLVAERVLKAPHLAVLPLLVYVGNPNYLYFNAQFAYESLALPLAVLTVAVVATGRATWPTVVAAVLIAVSVVTTHHMATYWLVAVLAGWALVTWLQRRGPEGGHLAPIAWTLVGTALAAAAWQVGVAKDETDSEVAPTGEGLAAFFDLVTGRGEAKKLFTSSAGEPQEGVVEQFLGLAHVGITAGLLPLGLWLLWRRNRHPLLLVLAGMTLLYPLTLALRLTPAGTETSNRASEYLFVGIGLALVFVHAALTGRISTAEPGRADRRRRAVLARVAVTAAVAVVFAGGFIVGWPPYTRQPGPYLVAADPRSVDALSVETAYWMRRHLDPNEVIIGDRVNSLTAMAYGQVDQNTGLVAGHPVFEVFFSPTFGETERQIIQVGDVDYILLDRRLAEAVPLTGYYGRGERELPSYQEPVPVGALAKFDGIPELDRVYDAGPIQVYGTVRVR